MDLIEIHATDFLKARRRLDVLAGRGRLTVRSGCLSLGTPGPLDSGELFWLSVIANRAEALWIAEPAAFSRSSEVDLGSPIPVCPSKGSVSLVADHARQVMDRCGRALLLENIASHIQARGPMRETEFLNRVCEVAGCGLALDLAALFVNSRNHRFSALSWLREIDPGRIEQVRLGGWTERKGWLVGEPQDRIRPELWPLLDRVLSRAAPKAIVLEFGSLPALAELESEIGKLGAIAVKAARRSGS